MQFKDQLPAEMGEKSCETPAMLLSEEIRHIIKFKCDGFNQRSISGDKRIVLITGIPRAVKK